jgi:3-dehydroquinate dehydratase-2
VGGGRQFRLPAAVSLTPRSQNETQESGGMIYVLNGPNLNLLGRRQPEIYGTETLADVEAKCRSTSAAAGLSIRFLQSNAEHDLIGWIHEAREEARGIVINPAAFSHSSVAVLDALNAFDGPVIEIHISNTHRRESFRHHSFVSQRADAVITGCGVYGYVLALLHMAEHLKART